MILHKLFYVTIFEKNLDIQSLKSEKRITSGLEKLDIMRFVMKRFY